MSKKNISNIGKIVLGTSEEFVRNTFNKISSKIESIRDLSETEQVALKFALEAFEYFESKGDVPEELEESFTELKQKLDKLENEN